MREALLSPRHVALTDRDKEALAFIEHVTRHAHDVQCNVLSTILARNSETEYLRRFQPSGRIDSETFKTLVPVIEYEDLIPDIQRIANGDTSPILTTQRISEFLTSSGTSGGERKLMPTVEEEFERRSLLYSLLMPVMNQYVQGLQEGKGMYLLFVKSETRTPGGLVARPVLTSYYKSEWFRQELHAYTSPLDTILCGDTQQSMYCQLLCGLIQRSEVVRLGAVFASGFLRAVRFLQERWQDLCRDLRAGALCGNDVVDAAARAAVLPLLRGADVLAIAAAVEAECRRPGWQGIIRRLWPAAKYVDVIVTGSMAQYIPTLDYFAGGLPLVSTMYGSSECYFGLNLRPLSAPSAVAYTLMPNMAFFEFLPLPHCTTSAADLASRLVDLVHVQIGHDYELVITTYAGLYRYRVGDVLRVTGFHNKAPQFQFVCRKNVVLSIDADKTDEESLQKAVSTATSKHLDACNVRLVEYTSYADLSTIPGHYVLYWELSCSQESLPEASVLEDCCLAIEDCLDSVYRQGRVSDKSIGPLEIRVVKPGTFDALMDYCLTRGASINQYKTPRCVNFTPIVELLNSRATNRFFSPKCPFWAPGRREWSANCGTEIVTIPTNCSNESVCES